MPVAPTTPIVVSGPQMAVASVIPVTPNTTSNRSIVDFVYDQPSGQTGVPVVAFQVAWSQVNSGGESTAAFTTRLVALSYDSVSKKINGKVMISVFPPTGTTGWSSPLQVNMIALYPAAQPIAVEGAVTSVIEVPDEGPYSA